MEQGNPRLETACVAMARSAPFSFTTIPMISTSLGISICSSTFSLSANCGIALGETKLTASMCLNPASIRARRYRVFSSVGICRLRPCHASRGHSISVTALRTTELLRLSKEFLRAIEETFAHWSVFLAAKRGELLKLLALLWIQPRWHFDDQPREKIARTRPVHVGYAFATEFEHLTALRACGDFNMRLAFKRRYVDLAAQRRNGKRDWHVAIQIVCFAMKDFVLFNVNHHVKVTRCTAADPGLAVS